MEKIFRLKIQQKTKMGLIRATWKQTELPWHLLEARCCTEKPTAQARGKWEPTCCTLTSTTHMGRPVGFFGWPRGETERWHIVLRDPPLPQFLIGTKSLGPAHVVLYCQRRTRPKKIAANDHFTLPFQPLINIQRPPIWPSGTILVKFFSEAANTRNALILWAIKGGNECGIRTRLNT